MAVKILLTGATGFVGGALYRRFVAANANIVIALRNSAITPDTSAKSVEISGIDGNTDWSEGLAGVGQVIHTAARVHVMSDAVSDSLAEYRKINVDGTLNLAQQAAAAGVRRFIFISSIKVNGKATLPGKPYRADDKPAPTDPYGISKMEAENGLRVLSLQTGMEVVIIRPVLVYGPGVKANFLSMMCWVQRGIPLPLAAIHNKRSLVALDNLVDLIVTCVEHPRAANQTFLVSDGEDLSVSDLLRRMAAALGRPARLLPLPAVLLELAAAVLGKRDMAQRLCGSLQVDISKTCELLGWSPPVSVDEALRRTAVHFLRSQGD